MAAQQMQETPVLVTGGGGFIGSELTRQLADLGANVTVIDNFSSGKREYIDNLPVKVVKADICDKSKVAKVMRDQEIVYHLAALPFIPDAYVNPEEFFRVNVEGSLNLVWQAVKSDSVKRFIYLSSSEVYGTAQTIPMNEDHPTRPHSTYAVSKLAADRAVFTIHKEQGIPAIIMRLFNTYGPRITQPYIIPEITIQLLRRNSDLKLGNIQSSRDFTFVSDSARALVSASYADGAVGEVINVGSGSDVKILDLANQIAEIIGTKFMVREDSSRFRPYDVDRLVCDATKAKRLLAWEPKVDLKEGLKTTVDWIRQNKISFAAPFRGAQAWYRDGAP